MKGSLKERRTAKGYTQADMARFLDCTEQYYNLIENERRRPGVERAKIIGKVLNVDWTKFYDEEADK